MTDTLHVFTPIFNPWRYRSRYRLYDEFRRHVEASGAKLTTFELAFGHRPFEIPHADYQARTHAELWHKERMLNLMIRAHDDDCKYVAWIDADLHFARKDWVAETIHRLQHYPVVQLFSHAIDLGPHHEHLKTHVGIIYADHEGKLTGCRRYDSFHPGFAWAARRETLDQLGGLIDIAVLGSADRHMALALLDRPLSIPKGLTAGYISPLNAWRERASRVVRGQVGYVPGTVLHSWHGKKVDRRYGDRWKILVQHKFDPSTDLVTDRRGLWAFAGNKPRMERDFRRYFQGRNEDSIDV